MIRVQREAQRGAGVSGFHLPEPATVEDFKHLLAAVLLRLGDVSLSRDDLLLPETATATIIVESAIDGGVVLRARKEVCCVVDLEDGEYPDVIVLLRRGKVLGRIEVASQ